MKKIFCFAIFVILFALGCGKSGFSGSVSEKLKSLLDPFSSNTKVVAASVFAIDGNNNNLGLVLGVSPSNFVVLTPNGYIHNIDWAGNDHQIYPGFYYSGGSCLPTDTIYINPPSSYSRGAFVYYSSYSGLLIPNTVNADGTAVTAMATYNSSYLSGMGCSASTNTINLIQLRPVTRADIGLPTSITPPIQIVSQ